MFKLTQDRMPIFYRVDAVQAGIEERFEIILVFAGGDRLDDLIAVQIREKSGMEVVA